MPSKSGLSCIGSSVLAPACILVVKIVPHSLVFACPFLWGCLQASSQNCLFIQDDWTDVTLFSTFPSLVVHYEESCSFGHCTFPFSVAGTLSYCCLSTICWIVLTKSLTKSINLFRLQGPKFRSKNKIINRPSKVEIKVVNQG